MSSAKQFTAAEVVDLIAARHTDDVFIPECKGGPTWFGEHDRMDAWAMRKSWSRPCTWGYEVKVSRGDWLKDQKWQAYLAYCNQFYFVCPGNVIKPEEVPDTAGLLYVASTGRSLFTKKKAPHRDVAIPEDLWRYVLMSRARIIRAKEAQCPEPSREERIQKWKERITSNNAAKEIGYYIARKTADRHNELECENVLLKQENEALALFRQRLSEIPGIRLDKHVREWNVRSALTELGQQLPYDVEQSIDAAARTIKRLQETIAQIKGERAQLAEVAK